MCIYLRRQMQVRQMQVCLCAFMSTQTNRKEKRECHSRNCASLQKAKWINLSEKVKLSEDTLHTASVRQKNQH